MRWTVGACVLAALVLAELCGDGCLSTLLLRASDLAMGS